MITPKQASDFISRSRAAARLAKALKDEITSLTDIYTDQKIVTDLTIDHFTGDNVGLDMAEFQAAVLALGAITTNLKAGGAPTILTKLLKIV